MAITLGDQTSWHQQGLEYLRYQYPLKRNDLVLDLGSYNREFANEIIRLYGCRVECFDCCDNRAAATYDGKMKIGGAYYYTSALEETLHSECDCVDIAKYITEPVALLKCNIEGMEYLLTLYLLDCGLFSLIDNFQVQFHIVDGLPVEALYEEIVEELSKTHELQWRYPYCWESWKKRA